MRFPDFAVLMSSIVVISISFCSAKAGESKEMTERQFTLESIGSVQKSGEHTRLVLDKSFESGLLGLEDFSHVWVFWWFDQNDTPEERATLQVHPRGNKNNPLTGVFATRSPARPNLIAMSLCRILSIKDNVVEIETIDAYAGTPVLDLKPYIPDDDFAEASVPDWIHNPDDMNSSQRSENSNQEIKDNGSPDFL